MILQLLVPLCTGPLGVHEQCADRFFDCGGQVGLQAAYCGGCDLIESLFSHCGWIVDVSSLFGSHSSDSFLTTGHWTCMSSTATGVKRVCAQTSSKKL